MEPIIINCKSYKLEILPWLDRNDICNIAFVFPDRKEHVVYDFVFKTANNNQQVTLTLRSHWGHSSVIYFDTTSPDWTKAVDLLGNMFNVFIDTNKVKKAAIDLLDDLGLTPSENEYADYLAKSLNLKFNKTIGEKWVDGTTDKK